MKSPLKWMRRFHLEGLLESPTSSLCRSKTSKFVKSRVISTRQSSVITKNLLGSLKNSIFTIDGAYSSARCLWLAEYRRFCTYVATKESQTIGRKDSAVAQVQGALMDYLHGTRGLHFPDAEHIAKNSLNFIGKLFKKVENEENIGRAISRFFCYHPINEFEPFFESIGLNSNEISLFLPRDLMFLSEDEELIENYHVLCNYGIAREKIGKIYRETTEIFRYQYGVLGLKLRAYEELGLRKSTIIKVISSSPTLLIGGVNKDFVKVLEKLESMGFERDWIGGVLSEKNSYNWTRMLVLLQFFAELGFTDEQMGALIRRQPGFMLDGSGNTAFLLVGLLLKAGGTKKILFSLFSQFPNIQISIFMRNLWRGLMFLVEIEMSDADILKLLLSHIEMLGTYYLKKPNTVLTYLCTGKGRLCRIIKEDPDQLKKYALGVKVNPLPNLDDKERALEEKKKFLMHLGFTEDSEEMKKALTVFRGKGNELQDRYDLFVNLGLHPNDVSNMLKMSPHILNQKIDVLKSKISFLVNDLGYPLSSLVPFPSYLSYTTQRANLRVSMYNWLKDKGKAPSNLALSSILACSDKVFMKRFVNHDLEGSKVWENLKKSLYPS
ncbi:transcription termination factor MTEF18, mitochondrial-like [Canna indica]|uniref:Transcription termination factor MTEF18, mitochondrial-like n=1 Tax=Canna indica TaxID=4628 RepID=A0AAQ3QJT0_9LILI|nr:transcription termination factor MTEF18, mitochondrial-like [Canna indica]